MYLLQSSQKVQSSVQTKEQESGPGWPKQDTEACQFPWFSYPKDGAARDLTLWGSKSKPACKVLG